MLRNHINWSYLASIGIILSIALSNCNAKPDEPLIQVRGAWSRPGTGAVARGAFYMTIENEGGQADRLHGGTSSACVMLELHRTVETEGGGMGMRAVEGGILIPAGEEVSLEPGGYHFMCIEPAEVFEVGDQLPVELNFETSGSMDVQVEVREGG